MSPENATIGIIDDDRDFAETAKEYIESSGHGHKVAAMAHNLSDAMTLLDQVPALGVDTLLIDGNLTETDDSGRDAQTLLKSIKQRGLKVHTVGISSQDIPGLDINAGSNKGPQLGDIIKSL